MKGRSESMSGGCVKVISSSLLGGRVGLGLTIMISPVLHSHSHSKDGGSVTSRHEDVMGDGVKSLARNKSGETVFINLTIPFGVQVLRVMHCSPGDGVGVHPRQALLTYSPCLDQCLSRRTGTESR